ncbi:MAG: hypothetical protein IKI21_01870 [Oscillospiraceae bacterium]|nr:hypothetical protein [Oscillospiraceae bacterium]
MKEMYQHMNDQLHPSAQMQASVMREVRRPQHRTARRITISVLAAAACMTSLTVAAGTNEDFRQALYDISPVIGRTFSPVMETCVRDGIEMKVEGVKLEDDHAEVIVAFRDTTGQGRAESIDLCDSYSLQRGPLPFMGEIASSGITGSYDPETGINRKHIYIDEPGMVDKEGQQIVFSVKRAVIGEQHAERIPVEVDLSAVDMDPATRSAEETLIFNDVYGGTGGGGEDFEEGFDYRAQDYLVPNRDDALADGITLTGIGWKDGLLHVQYRIDKQVETTWAGFYLVSDTTESEGAQTVTWSPEKGMVMHETFFRIAPEELADYRLECNMVYGGTQIDGDWKVSFTVGE